MMQDWADFCDSGVLDAKTALEKSNVPADLTEVGEAVPLVLNLNTGRYEPRSPKISPEPQTTSDSEKPKDMTLRL